MWLVTRLYDIAVAVIALGLLLGLFTVTAYVLTDGVMAHFFGTDLQAWIKQTTGMDFPLLLERAGQFFKQLGAMQQEGAGKLDLG